MPKITKIINGLKDTRVANLRLGKWLGNHNMVPKHFLSLPTAQQKGVFELFFIDYNIGIYIRSTGYDMFALNRSLINKEDKEFADFLVKAFGQPVVSNDGDYYWKRHWEEKPPAPWDTSETLRYEYFTIKCIVETMRFVNILKPN